jgi:hypothetical protein
MKTQSALFLFQYWNRLRKGAAAPCRTSIEPSDIRDVLSQTFILKADSSNSDMVFRLAGTSISSFFGRQLRNTPVRQLFPERHRAVTSRLLRNCHQDFSVVLLGLEATTRNGRRSDIEILLLPLEPETEGTHVLGCIVPHQPAFWHGLEAASLSELQSIRLIDPSRETLFLANRPEISISPSLVPEEQTLNLSGPKTVSQLLVIQGGKSMRPQSSITKL